MNSTMVYTILFFYAVFMVFIGLTNPAKKNDINDLNVANRGLGWVQSAFSISATWIWAPALFVASQRAYVDGLLGFGWFFVPNVLALLLFAIISRRSIAKIRDEHTLAQLMGNIYESKRMKKIYDFELLVLATCSTGVQLLAGGRILNLLTGVNFGLITLGLGGLAFLYSFFSGIRASTKTDVVQMILMLVTVIVSAVYLVPKHGLQLGGIDDITTNIFSGANWKMFLAFGLTTTIGLLSGPVGDQTFWQRAFSMKQKNIFKSFALASVLFAVIPLGMALIGFSASNIGFIPQDRSIVGLEYVVAYAPTWIISLFLLCIVGGLSSTLDSNMCAVGSIFSSYSRTAKVKMARLGMVLITLFGIIVSNIPNLNIFWLFLFYGVLRSSVAVPTIVTMMLRKPMKEKYVFGGIVGAFTIGVPVYLIGAIYKITNMALAGTLLTILIPTIFILVGLGKNKGGHNCENGICRYK